MDATTDRTDDLTTTEPGHPAGSEQAAPHDAIAGRDVDPTRAGPAAQAEPAAPDASDAQAEPAAQADPGAPDASAAPDGSPVQITVEVGTGEQVPPGRAGIRVEGTVLVNVTPAAHPEPAPADPAPADPVPADPVPADPARVDPTVADHPVETAPAHPVQTAPAHPVGTQEDRVETPAPTATPTPGRPTPGRPAGGPRPGGPRPSGPRPGGPRPAGRRPTGSGPGGKAAPGDGGDEPAATEADLTAAAAFGRVAEDGAVFVRTRTGERQVGSWAVGEHEEALAFFARRFVTLRTEVALAETRVRAGSLSAESAQTTVRRLREAVETAQAVGDLDELALRVDALDGLVAVARERRRTEKAAETAAARERKTALVGEAEQIGAGQNWRVGPEKLRLLFEEWKSLPRLDKTTDDDLWKRFSAARTTYTRRRKAHYAELTASREVVQTAKEALITEAEALAGSTEWGPTTAKHRVLMERWKAAGSAAKDVDDALWERFRAARQSFFETREAHDAERTSTERDNLAAREALLVEAEALLPVSDMKAARRTMRGIRERWDAVGHVPRGSVASVDARLKVVEDALRGAETQEWRRTDPEALRRAERTAEQLRPAIARLEKDVTAARGRGDARALREAEESLAARRQWLVQADRIINESH